MKRKEVKKGEKNYYKWIFTNKYYYILVIGISILINIPFLFNLSNIPFPLHPILSVLFFIVDAIMSLFIFGLLSFFFFFAYRYATTSKNFSKEKKTGILIALVVIVIISAISIIPLLFLLNTQSFDLAYNINSLLGLPIVIFWIWMIVDVSKRKFDYKKDKSFWIITMVITAYIGSILYYFIVKRYNRH